MNTKTGTIPYVLVSGEMHYLTGPAIPATLSEVVRHLETVIGIRECEYDDPRRIMDIVVQTSDGDRHYTSVRRATFRRDDWGDGKSFLVDVVASYLEAFKLTVVQGRKHRYYLGSEEVLFRMIPLIRGK